MKSMTIEGKLIRHFEAGDVTHNGVTTGDVRINYLGLREYLFSKGGCERWSSASNVSVPGMEEQENAEVLGPRHAAEGVVESAVRLEGLLHQAIAAKDLRDFILSAVANGTPIYSNDLGFAAIPAGDRSDFEGDELSADDALARFAAEWRVNEIEGRVYLSHSAHPDNWMWLSPDGEWLTDSDGSTNDPSRWPAVGKAADFIESL